MPSHPTILLFTGEASNASSPALDASFLECTQSSVNRKSWTGIVGAAFERPVSDLQSLLQQCSGFIHYGPNRFLSCIAANQTAPLNLSTCQVAVLLDKISSEGANQTQIKPALAIELESNVSSAILLTLRGVNSIVVTNWHSTPEDSRVLLSNIAASFLPPSDSIQLGPAVRQLSASVEVELEDPVDPPKKKIGSKPPSAAKLRPPETSPKKPLDPKSESGRQGIATVRMSLFIFLSGSN